MRQTTGYAAFVPAPLPPEPLFAFDDEIQTLLSSPILTISQVQKTLGITYPPANALVQRFVEAGILFEMTGQERYRVYRFSPYIGLFSDNREEPQLDHGPSHG